MFSDAEQGAGHPLGEGGAAAVVPGERPLPGVPPRQAPVTGPNHRRAGRVRPHEDRLQTQAQEGEGLSVK